MKEVKWVYIMLTDTGTWLTRLIKKYTDAPYNHVSIGLDENFNSLYSFGRRKPTNPFYGGFVKEDVVSGTYRLYPDTICAMYRIKVTEKQYRRIKRIIKKFERKKNKYTYNFIGLLTVTIDKPIKRRTSYFCSQFVTEVFKQAGIELFQKSSGLVTPDDFRKLEQLELVYEGKLYENHKVVEKVGEVVQMDDAPNYQFFLKPMKKTIQFVNPIFYYQIAVDRGFKKK